MNAANESVELRLEALDQLDLAALWVEWGKAFGRPTPLRLGRDLLGWMLAHRIQEQAWGGLQPAARRRLQRLAGDLQTGAPLRAAPAPRPSPGARLLREWNGETHVVDVLTDGGFAWRGQSYRSLSEIARAITGARWSGPRFFGATAARPTG